MNKKIKMVSIITAVMIMSVGCSASGKQLDAISGAQEKLVSLNSAHMTVEATMKTDSKTDFTSTEFSFVKNANGVYEYCQEGRDSNNKLVFCEISDGEKAEQWLIGKGWSTISPTVYTQDNNHRFMELITSGLDKKAISEITSVEEDTNTLYNIILDPKRLNETIYKDTSIEVKSQTVCFLVNADSQIISYDDEAVILDKSENIEAEYIVNAKISEHDSVTEVKKPEVKDTAGETETGETAAKIDEEK